MGSCLIVGKELSKETCAGKARDFIGRGAWVESSGVRETRRATLSCGSPSLVLVMGIVSGLSLANHSDSRSFLVVHTLLSQDGCQQEGSWEVVRQVVSPFDLS